MDPQWGSLSGNEPSLPKCVNQVLVYRCNRKSVELVVTDKVDKGIPMVHSDSRRDLFEMTDNVGRVTLIQVKQGGVSLGNHYHTFNERFVGWGKGTLYTCASTAKGTLHRQLLPAEGWSVHVPAGISHCFVFDGEANEEGHIATTVSYSPEPFLESENTIRCKIL